MKHGFLIAVTCLFLGLAAVIYVIPSSHASLDADLSVELDGSGASVTPEQEIVVRRLWEGSDPDFWSADVSPDGRFTTEIDWSNGLSLLDLHERSLEPVTARGAWDPSGEWGGYAIFSPDGERLAYTWYDEGQEAIEIRTAALDGSGERTIYRGRNGYAYATLEGWSADGEWVLAQLWDSEPGRVSLLSVRDGTERTVFTGGAEFLDLSPDGRYVAFSVPPREQEKVRDVFSVPVDGGPRTTLLDGPSDDRLMGWAPDGSGILVARRDGSTESLWWITVTDGAPVGRPQLVKADVWRPQPIGFSDDGRFFYGVITQVPTVHIAGIDLGASRLTTAAVEAEEEADVRSRFPTWSPDGRFLAYIKDVPGLPREQVVVRAADSGTRQVIPFDGRILQLEWSSDGSQIVIDADKNGNDERSIYTIDLSDGETRLYRRRPEGLPAGRLHRDGRTYVFPNDWRNPGDESLIAMDLETGTERVLLKSTEGFGNKRMSPDGRSFVLFRRDTETGPERLMVMTISDGTFREVLSYTGATGATLDWTHDGRTLLFSTLSDDPSQAGLWQVPVSGGERRRVEGVPPQTGRFSIHPSGNRIAFVDGERRGEVWVLEGLDVGRVR